MKNIRIMTVNRKKVKNYFIICIASLVFIYLLVSLFFSKHFFFNTIINGVNVSMKAYSDADRTIKDYTKNYKLLLSERNNESEVITGQEIGLQYRENRNMYKIFKRQNPFLWVGSMFKHQKIYIKDLYYYDQDLLSNRVNGLFCLNRNITEPRNVGFLYSNGGYDILLEEYGNKVNKNKLVETIKIFVLMGNTILDLNATLCYDNPMYTVNSKKTGKTLSLLNKFVSTKITYRFNKKIELLDGNIINQWLSVDDDLDVAISKAAVMEYVKSLSKKYDTVGIARAFTTATGKKIEVKGGLYGWKIDKEGETGSIIENINRGEVIEKEPVYIQKALSRDENEIGNTYVEISITRQHLWFFKDGKLLTQGAVVTGNPNRGNSTVVGVYMVNYKQKGATLEGPGYEAKVTYWIPFFGNMGIHDASWRSAFGGEIYKTRGTHGCVNAPYYLAKTIFENIEEGIPVVIYKEE